MHLESKWNQLYLEKGRETLDMMQIEFELKNIKSQIREQDALSARQELDGNNSEEDLDIAS